MACDSCCPSMDRRAGANATETCLKTAPETDARASEPQTPDGKCGHASGVKSLEATVDKMEVELQSLEETLKRCDTSRVEVPCR